MYFDSPCIILNGFIAPHIFWEYVSGCVLHVCIIWGLKIVKDR